MTLQEYQDYLHSLYLGNSNTPSSGSDRWNHRVNLLASAIGLWEAEKGMEWRGLWVNLSDAADGDKTVNASDLIYSTPTDFKKLGAFVRVTDSNSNDEFYDVIKPAEAELYANTTAAKVFQTGNDSTGFSINFLKQPTAGYTINYPYYKKATVPSAVSDVIEMSDPWFAVYYALSKLHENAGDGDRASLALDVADTRMSAMRTFNESLPPFQTNNIPDRRSRRGVGGFGR